MSDLKENDLVQAEEILKEALKYREGILKNESLVEQVLRLDYIQDLPPELLKLAGELAGFTYKVVSDDE